MLSTSASVHIQITIIAFWILMLDVILDGLEDFFLPFCNFNQWNYSFSKRKNNNNNNKLDVPNYFDVCPREETTLAFTWHRRTQGSN